MPRLPLLLAIPIALVACGDDEHGQPDAAIPDAGDPDAGGPFGSVSLDELPDALERAVCGFEVRCGLMPDGATCRDAFDPAATDVAQLAAYAGAGKLTYDPDKAGDCLTAYRDAACTWSDGGIGPAAVCDEVFVGDKAPDVPCLVDEECAGDMICETQACADGCCAGVCRAKTPEVAIGEDCSAAPCAADAYCRLDGAGGATCTARAPAGGLCTSIEGCAADAVCDLDPATGQGSCVALAADNATCDPALAIGGCLGIDRWCDPASSRCEHRAEVDQGCGSDAQCIEAAACVSGTCRARPGLGDACGESATGSRGCLGGLVCAGGACAADPAQEVCP